ncbi:adenosylmethionine--8-amino-7-oxononanoate transaminase [Pseudonocardia sp. KRD-184]|uniref:Adenosylmethionine-8-amino-7-oxononanoate aminotransferase n=1 Tax=Pseudonocardia oceani TaxID=2792013 RepID=A0ABS6UFM0_9PSEU|nr:adenosylmethionine--8-amino-7-oxononanoate transaminase [Pseudonocardia oceani]MBW0092701.1 adenosylmethionine--8-amino-7-oxononanoate transaminase [Pseudonocardia oceani]MBW0098846.1 adenosylmethionine--8-amino-7-oxononanoate transaminase [Pseudonocardia oceani]MBW0112008.1 adenosylmethionine--8-amino-7-oxononanoate transaminase [Pseudonocardia oceani]MBW0121197.1 adenosylmethionine--8-amino-7-oxononanoate transaminase [Pseudonocardia oceani]MBW0131050.1 adenosylmethionine--8-amino-7-oxono
MEITELVSTDRQHVWHPYAPMPATTTPLPVASAAGVRLTLADGRELVDGMSSWWAAIHGYAHPVLDAAVRDQLGSMSHVMFGGLTHSPAVELARLLVDVTPAGLEHVFLADSGSVSVEVAIKMCLQYQRSRGRPGKHRLMTWRGGYHGDTFGAMSVCDPDGGMHSLWSDVLPQQVFASAPPREFETAYVAELADLVERHADELAAVIVEPVVQGAGGMRFHDPRYLHVLRELCLTHDVLLVFDEIATGFGRTGEMFAADHAGIAPDVLCVGKALTGGYLTMAAALCTSAVARGISDGAAGVLMHGPTFMGNPLAAAVAGASVRLLGERDWRGEVAGIATALTDGLAPARAVPGVVDVRVLGAIGVVQLDHEVDMAAASAAAVDAGVWLRPFRDLVYTMPPYVCTPDDLAAITAAVCAAAAAG